MLLQCAHRTNIICVSTMSVIFNKIRKVIRINIRQHKPFYRNNFFTINTTRRDNYMCHINKNVLYKANKQNMQSNSQFEELWKTGEPPKLCTQKFWEIGRANYCTMLFNHVLYCTTDKYKLFIKTHSRWNSKICVMLANTIFSFPCISSGSSISLIVLIYP